MVIGDERETIETGETFRTFETGEMIGLTQCLNDLNFSFVNIERRTEDPYRISNRMGTSHAMFHRFIGVDRLNSERGSTRSLVEGKFAHREIVFAIQMVLKEEMLVLHRSSADDTDSTATMIDSTENVAGIVGTGHHFPTFAAFTYERRRRSTSIGKTSIPTEIFSRRRGRARVVERATLMMMMISDDGRWHWRTVDRLTSHRGGTRGRIEIRNGDGISLISFRGVLKEGDRR